ncbi:V-type ATP synthase subunit F [Candidatus Woesearchaeota archaeon]|nr:V-type ATP synthase subunit F [Candidatus Woesearchaeota archaeon]
MAILAVVGDSKFILGFQLAGIRKTVIADEQNPLRTLREVMQDKNVGIVIVDEDCLNKVHPHDRRFIEDSVQPVVIPLSTKASQDNLRQLIKRSIGVDLMKEA